MIKSCHKAAQRKRKVSLSNFVYLYVSFVILCGKKIK